MQYSKRELAARHAAARWEGPLNGVHLAAHGAVCATNGHMYIAILDPTKETGKREPITVPLSSVEAERKLLTKKDDRASWDTGSTEPFPKLHALLPRGGAEFTVRVNTNYLEAICKALREYRLKPEDIPTVDIEYRGEGLPLVLRGTTETVAGFTALLATCIRS